MEAGSTAGPLTGVDCSAGLRLGAPICGVLAEQGSLAWGCLAWHWAGAKRVWVSRWACRWADKISSRWRGASRVSAYEGCDRPRHPFPVAGRQAPAHSLRNLGHGLDLWALARHL